MILFTHIEKCAGTSFNEMLSLTYLRYFHITKNHYGGNDLRNDLTQKEFKRLMSYYPSIIGGHSVRPYLSFFSNNQTIKKITFLRNPIERYMSQYNHDHERGFSPDIDYFINRSYTENFMVNKLAGENNYDKALTHLNTFFFVGDADRYLKSLQALSDKLQTPFYGFCNKKNVRSNNETYLRFEDLNESQKMKIYEKNKLDIKLYETCILKSDFLSSYDGNYIFKTPSKTRVKIVNKLNKRKKKLINSIRTLND